uniref:DUF659 domain-containing protein n=1 Tax=Lactuca sativa TaxID=4236 RepID=A0A9R1VF72_LACSA|nr:hypothetical protein LSAT_V11C500246480 [Lactuca sativa]
MGSTLEDLGRRYGKQDLSNKNNFGCSFCGRFMKGGEDVVEISGSSKMPPPKKPRQKGSIDMYYPLNPQDAMKVKKNYRRQQTINEVYQKDLSHKVCRHIGRWVFYADILFNSATYANFKFVPGLKPLSMNTLRVPILKHEVKYVQKQLLEHEEEWAAKGCSIMGRVARFHGEKNIITFMVKSQKGLVSLDVSDFSKDADLLFRVLDKMVEEVTKFSKSKRPNLYWTPCVAYCLDLMLEDNEKQVPMVKSALKKLAITRLVTFFSTLAQNYKRRSNLRNMWMGPLFNVLRIVDGEKYPVMGYIYEAMDRAKKGIRDSFLKPDYYKTTFKIIDCRWECQLHRTLHAAGHFLNPRIFYKDVFWPAMESSGVACKEVEKSLYDCIMRLVHEEQVQDKISEDLDIYRNA